MSRFYSFNYLNKELGCACDLRDFLPNEKHLLTHYDKLPTELYKLFFVEDVCNILIFKSKKEILTALKKMFENEEIYITAEEFKRFKKEIKSFKE